MNSSRVNGNDLTRKTNNYQSWFFKIADFFNLVNPSEKLKFLLRYAVLAPSSHNIQPWEFKIENNEILVCASNTRKLPFGDTDNRQLYISLGCAVKNILIAADYYGYIYDLKHENGSVKIKLTERQNKQTSSINHLIFSIQKRMVNRGPYKNEPIDIKIIEELEGIAKKHNVVFNAVSDTKNISDLSDIALSATYESMTSDKFRNELSKCVLPNNTKKKIGMPGFSLGFPLPISFFAPYLLRKFNLSKLSNKKDEVLFKKHTPCLIILSTELDNIEDWINVGQTAQEIFLTLTSYELSSSIWAAPIQIGNYFEKIKTVLNIKSRPQMFFRIGFPLVSMGGHSPRLSVEDTLK